MKIKRLQGVNALFAFLDEALPNHDPEGKGHLEATAQIFLLLYVIGMAKAWCELMEMEDEDNLSQRAISHLVMDGLYYRYDLEFRSWSFTAEDFLNPENREYAKHKFGADKIEQGREHFHYFMKLRYIPHNPLDLLLNQWSQIAFYGVDYSDDGVELISIRGEIEGVFTKEEYEFWHSKMYYLREVDDDRERSNSAFLRSRDRLDQYPFINDAYPK